MESYITPVPYPSAPSMQIQHESRTIAAGPANEMTEEQIKTLGQQGFTRGLAISLSQNNTTFPLRIWVVDNSGSMQKTDGHRIVKTSSGNIKTVDCTRWEEIKESVTYHAQMADLLQAETWFKLLNDPGARVGPQQFEVASNQDTTNNQVQHAINIMSNTSPGGVTPLTDHVSEIYMVVDSLRPQLEAEGKKVAIILATDGLPTDNQGHHNEYVKKLFVDSLRRLEGLPVWLVIRLCTDEEDVVEFYNNLDEQLELSMDVLDDFCGEAEEVFEHNSFLNYTLHIHRLREMGFHHRVFDMIDERPLTKGELRDLCVLIFGIGNFDGVPDPDVNWKGFLNEIKTMMAKEKTAWNPMKKKVMPLLDVKKMDKVYGDKKDCVIM